MAAEATKTAIVLQRFHRAGIVSLFSNALPLGLIVSANALLLWFFHDRFWYPADEGNYAHVAQRLLAGEVLNRDVQDIHAGYINFVNATAFRLFGLDLLSLRYPLVAITLVQAILIFFLFWRTGRKQLAIAAAIAISALGLVQYLNPTANWYGLFIAILIVCALEWIPRYTAARLLVVGLLVGALVLFRQLSGALVGISVLTYLLLESRSATAVSSWRDLVLARLLIAIMTLGLGVYVVRATDVMGLVLFGTCPLLLLLWLFIRTSSTNRQVLKIVTPLSIGGIVASLPLLAYHLIHRSVNTWLNDTVFSAIGLTRLEFMDQQTYGKLVTRGFWQLAHISNAGEFFNSLYWIALPTLAFVNGILLLSFLLRNWKQENLGSPRTYAVAVIALFYGIVSIHFQIPIYLYYTAGLSLAGILWLSPCKPRFEYSALAFSLVLSGVGVYYHAGQPLSGRFSVLVSGQRNIRTLDQTPSSLPRVSLKIEPEEDAQYSDLLKRIDAETTPSDAIFAFPTNAELYFLSGRRNPFRFYNTALGIRNADDLRQVQETIITQPPRLIVHRKDDKYETAYSRDVLQLVKDKYDFIGDSGDFEIYRSRP
jgi:hypothetical protein